MSIPFHSLPARGFTLMELLFSAAITGMLVAGLALVVSQALQSQTVATERNRQLQEARFAMERMVNAVTSSKRLMLPLADNPSTDWPEHIREQTIPASPPVGSSTFASAVLAVTLGTAFDLNRDGWADANNDKDFLDLNQNLLRDTGEPERVDEDLSGDNSNDGYPGIVGIDDDGDGSIDESDGSDPFKDDDEEGVHSDDPVDGVDNDNDGSVDEDQGPDMNFDGNPGLAGVDDDRDGSVDEGHQHDDDEDGVIDEDWYDPVVYYLNGNTLIERWPAQIDTNGDSVITGLDYTESVIAEGVSGLRIERLPLAGGRAQLVEITLTLNGTEPLTLTARVRVGGGL